MASCDPSFALLWGLEMLEKRKCKQPTCIPCTAACCRPNRHRRRSQMRLPPSKPSCQACLYRPLAAMQPSGRVWWLRGLRERHAVAAARPTAAAVRDGLFMPYCLPAALLHPNCKLGPPTGLGQHYFGRNRPSCCAGPPYAPSLLCSGCVARYEAPDGRSLSVAVTLSPRSLQNEIKSEVKHCCTQIGCTQGPRQRDSSSSLSSSSLLLERSRCDALRLERLLGRAVGVGDEAPEMSR